MTDALAAWLGMYDYAWTAKANDALWAALAARLRGAGIDAPPELTRGADPHQIWRDPRLIFGQTCGYPYVTGLSRLTAIVATPRYAFDGCEGAFHRSFVVARKHDARRELADFAGARAALNGRDSNSGMNLFRAMIAPLAQKKPFFSQMLVTGSHMASLVALREGAADLAAIDCVTYGLLRQGRPELTEATEIIARTPLTPALPFIMSAELAKLHLGVVREAFFATLEDPALETARSTLGLAGAEVLDATDYDRVAQIERDAIALGYPELA